MSEVPLHMYPPPKLTDSDHSTFGAHREAHDKLATEWTKKYAS